MGLTLEIRTKEVDIGFLVVYLLEECGNCDDHDSQENGPTLYEGEDGRHGGWFGLVIGLVRSILILGYTEPYLYEVV